MKIKHILFCCSILLHISVIQGISQQIERTGTERFEALECAPKDLGFEVNFDPTIDDIRDFENEDKIYICESQLPLLLKAKDLVTPISPPAGNDYAWNGVNDDEYGEAHEARLTIQDFTFNIASVKFTFTDLNGDDKKINIKFVLTKNFIIDDEKTNDLAAFSFDENKEKKYPFYSGGFPYKLLMSMEEDLVDFKKPRSIENLIIEDDVNQTKFNYEKNINVLSIEHLLPLSANENPALLSGCDEDIMRMDIQTAMTLNVNIISVGESDDDEANYCINYDQDGILWEIGDVRGDLMPDCITPISDSSHLCILPGLDKTLDLYRECEHDTAFWITKDNDILRPRDSIWRSGFGFDLKVLPSVSPDSTNKFFCNNRPIMQNLAPRPLLPTSVRQDIIDNLNTIFNPAGIEVIVQFSAVYENFDNKGVDDNKLSTTEQNSLHILIEGGINAVSIDTASEIRIWLVDDIYSSTETATSQKAGRATGFGFNTASVDFSIMGNRTISHEIGHAVFGLHHPDNSPGGDYLQGSVANDQYNFMNSGLLYSQPQMNIPIDKMRIRKYQWTKMRD